MKTIPLTNRNVCAIVDNVYYPALVAMGQWFETHGYAAVSALGQSRHIYMHDVVLGMSGITQYEIPDHINNNRLDNRLSNLRPATKAQNTQRGLFKTNSTGYRGVVYRKDLKSKPYRAAISYRDNGKRKTLRLGYFATAEEAARAYDEQALKLFGTFAFFNFPDDVKVEQPVCDERCFGWSYVLDMYGCKKGVCDDLELHYRFLETLVEALGMDKMSAPFVIHAPKVGGHELYPDKAGVSGWIPLIQSGISIHSIEPTRFATLDVYSCKRFTPGQVIDVAKPLFKYTKCEEHFIERGSEYEV